ncbi:MAG TPA: PIN domain-containing protein [Thermoanaerobaculia bacterium]|nr:PIN domain-containing protein [Thermoanaerobaculia bacterium]
MELIEAIGAGPVAIETAIFIYFIEQHPRFAPPLQPLFAAIDAGAVKAVTSAVTLLETLVVPYRAGDETLAAAYEAILTNGRGLTLVPIDLSLARLAAQLRATSRLRTPDALQLATALSMRCTAFLTNDRRVPLLRPLTVLQLADFA